MSYNITPATNGGFWVKDSQGNLLGHFNDQSDAVAFIQQHYDPKYTLPASK